MHDINECYDLKQQIENLIKQGKLRHFVGRDHKDEKLKAKMEESSCPPLGEIRVIIGGTLAGQTWWPWTRYLDKWNLAFSCVFVYYYMFECFNNPLESTLVFSLLCYSWASLCVFIP